MGRGSQIGVPGGLARPVVHQARPEFDAQDAPHRVVDAGLRNRSGHEPLERGLEQGLGTGFHRHVHSGVDGGGDLVGIGSFGKLFDAQPIGDDESVEAQVGLEGVGQVGLVLVHAKPVHRAVACHHGLDSRFHGRDVPGQMEGVQGRLGDHVVALVQEVRAGCLRGRDRARAVGRAAIPQEMLGAGHHREGGVEIPALQPADVGGPQGGGEFRTFTVGLVGAAPALVPRHRDARGEVPVATTGPHLLGGIFAQSPQQVGVARGAEADVVRKDHGAGPLGMPVDGVDPVEDGDLRLGRAGIRLQRVEVHDGVAAPAEDGAELVRGCQGPGILADQPLGHLPDLLDERQILHHGIDPVFDGIAPKHHHQARLPGLDLLGRGQHALLAGPEAPARCIQRARGGRCGHRGRDKPEGSPGLAVGDGQGAERAGVPRDLHHPDPRGQTGQGRLGIFQTPDAAGRGKGEGSRRRSIQSHDPNPQGLPARDGDACQHAAPHGCQGTGIGDQQGKASLCIRQCPRHGQRCSRKNGNHGRWNGIGEAVHHRPRNRTRSRPCGKEQDQQDCEDADGGHGGLRVAVRCSSQS